MLKPISLTLALLLCSSLSAQDMICSYQEITVTDGLPHPSVYHVQQDQNGYIWLATLNGIARYDGNRMRNYHPARDLDSLTTSRELPQVHVSATGTVWVAYLFAKHKIFRYDALRDTFLLFAGQTDNPKHPLQFKARALYEVPDETLWVNTGRQGLLAFDLRPQDSDTIPYQFYQQEVGNPNSLPTNYLAPGLWQDADGFLWIATEDGLTRLNPEEDRFETFRWSEREAGNEIISFLADTTRNCMWIGTFFGLVRFDFTTKEGELYQAYPTTDPSVSNFTGSLLQDQRGHIWMSVGIHPATLWTFDPERETFHQAKERKGGKLSPLPGANHLYLGQNHRIWSAGFTRGLQSISTQPANVAAALSDIPSNSDFLHEGVSALLDYDSTHFFIGTLEQGVWNWNRSSQTLTRIAISGLDQENPIEQIKYIERSANGTHIWILSTQNLYRLALPTGSVQHVAHLGEDLASVACGDIHQIGDYLWINCFRDGVYRISTENTTELQHFPTDFSIADSAYAKLPLQAIVDMATNVEKDQLWLATSYIGLLSWNIKEQRIKHYVPNLSIESIVPTPDGLVWLATASGLLLFDPEQDQFLPLPHLPARGLSFPQSLVLDHEGLLWIGAEQGIIAIDPNSRRVVHNLLASSWLPEGQPWYNGKMITYVNEQGEVFFANANGLFMIRPDQIYYDTIPPGLHLQRMMVNEEKQLLPSSPIEPIHLPYYQNDLSFTIASLHFKLPQENRISYQLRGFDESWRTISPDQAIVYPNLPAGAYELRVRATNADGYTGEEQLMASVRIRPPWFANKWAYFSYLILFLGAVYGLFRQQSQRLQRAAENKYWQELDLAKTKLFTNISHEFRTPLTLILGDAQIMLARLNGQVRTHAQRIQRGGQRMLWLVNQLLELAQADSGFLRLDPRQADIIPFLRYNLQAFASLTDPRDIALVFHSELKEQLMDFDPERLQRVLSNIILNAVHHTPDGGKIELMVDAIKSSLSGKMLSLQVRDNGVGIPEEELPFVFDRFHRATNLGGGAGIGLALVKEFIHLMKGQISVSSRLGEGTSFSIQLPVQQKAPLASAEWSMPILPTQLVAETRKQGPLMADTALPKVLVVEDNEDLRLFLRSCLEGDYRLSLARDGQEGLDMAQDEAFDLMISDVMMPRMDGFSLCQHVKEHIGTSHIPIILLTARADQQSRLEGFARGADAYLPKPFDPRELLARCRQLLQHRERLRAYYTRLLHTGSLTNASTSQEEPTEQAFIIKAQEVILAQLDNEDFSVDDLATKLGLSRSQLHRKLDQMVGMSTTRFIRSLRLQQARKMLQDPSYNIAEIAYACGYRDPDYFSRIFREEIGMSPTRFRKETPDLEQE